MIGTFTEDEKLLFVVRHGESKWNKAQSDKDIYTMLSSTDHPLNEKGANNQPRVIVMR
jgi:bisphosphoglycerate-dependent phosphoglycerate mutase